MSSILTAADAFVLATADDEMQDRWIPDEEWVRHIRIKEYLKPCVVNSLNFGISRRFQFYNDRYECPFAGRVLYFMHKHYVTVSKTTGEKKTIYFYFYLSNQNKAIPEISNQLEVWQDVWDGIKANGDSRINNLKREATTTPVGKKNLSKKPRLVSPEVSSRQPVGVVCEGICSLKLDTVLKTNGSVFRLSSWSDSP
jgi:hypothetical protein